jgi:hypothetical protein
MPLAPRLSHDCRILRCPRHYTAMMTSLRYRLCRLAAAGRLITLVERFSDYYVGIRQKSSIYLHFPYTNRAIRLHRMLSQHNNDSADAYGDIIISVYHRVIHSSLSFPRQSIAKNHFETFRLSSTLIIGN